MKRFLLDENVPLKSVERLREAGHDVVRPAVVYFRPPPETPEAPAERLLALLERPGFELEGKLTVVETGRVRQRPLPDA